MTALVYLPCQSAKVHVHGMCLRRRVRALAFASCGAWLLTCVLSSDSLYIYNGSPCWATGPGGAGGRVTRYVCAHCTATGELSHRGMFLNRASVRRHIAAAKPCREANLGIRELQVEARAGDVMAGGGGAAGPAPDVRHQPAGDVPGEITKQYTDTQKEAVRVCILVV